MQLHELKPKHRTKRQKRIGRGGKRGTYSGRGVKGQKSRAGRQIVPPIRQLVKKYPKLRGYRFKTQSPKMTCVNIKDLEQNFKEGNLVSPKTLLEKKLVRKIKGRLPQVKILGQGRLTKKLTVENCKVSKTAKEKIEKTKGKII